MCNAAVAAAAAAANAAATAANALLMWLLLLQLLLLNQPLLLLLMLLWLLLWLLLWQMLLLTSYDCQYKKRWAGRSPVAGSVGAGSRAEESGAGAQAGCCGHHEHPEEALHQALQPQAV